MEWTPDQVLEQSRRWRSSWHPPGSEHIVLGPHEFYLQDGEATLLNYHGPPGDPMDLLDDAGAAAGRLGASSMRLTVGPGVFADADAEELRRRDATTVAVIDIVALDLSQSSTLDPDIDAVTTTRVGDRDMLGIFENVSHRAWGFAPPVLADLESTPKADWPGMFLGSHRGRPAGAGGYALVDGVARLWGAAVLPEFRGHGVYRALVAVRVDDARSRGATLAMVHAEQTSSPILRRLGFRKYGERRLTRLPV